MSRPREKATEVKRGSQTGLAARWLAATTLAEILSGRSFRPLTAADLPDGRDRAFANRLITTALRRNGHLDVILSALLERGLPKRAGLFEPLLRIGLAELLFVEGAAPHAAIASAVGVLKSDRRGGHLSKLMNAVLREAQRRADEFTGLPPELLIPEPFRSNWRTRYGETALSRFAEALLAGAPLDLSFKTNDPELVAELGGHETLPLSSRVESRDRPVADLPGYQEGRWWVQDVAASIPARLIDLAPGARVLDLCAAPGGKTAQLCAKGYEVTALDNDADRLGRLEENLARLGFSARIVCADATAPLALDPFDAILIDAPCSATGTFRRHPEVLVNRSAADIAGRVELQRRIIVNAVPLLKPGGILVFATCSLETEEGEDQADWISTRYPQLRPAPVRAETVPHLAPAVSAQGLVRTHPGLDWPEIGADGMDGFFITRYVLG